MPFPSPSPLSPLVAVGFTWFPRLKIFSSGRSISLLSVGKTIVPPLPRRCLFLSSRILIVPSRAATVHRVSAYSREGGVESVHRIETRCTFSLPLFPCRYPRHDTTKRHFFSLSSRALERKLDFSGPSNENWWPTRLPSRLVALFFFFVNEGGSFFEEEFSGGRSVRRNG